MPNLPNDKSNGEDTYDHVGNLGGTGEIHSFRLLKRAMEQKWELPEHYLKALPSEAAEFFRKDAAGKYVYTARNRLAAIRVLATMHGQNQDDLSNKLQQIIDEQRAIVNVNVGVQVGAVPTQEIVVDTREEVQEFSEIKKRLNRIEANRNGNSEGNGKH